MEPIKLPRVGIERFLLGCVGCGVSPTLTDDGCIVYRDEVEPRRMVVKELSLDSFISTAKGLPRMIVDPRLELTREEVIAIAGACRQRLKNMDQDRQEYELITRCGQEERGA